MEIKKTVDGDEMLVALEGRLDTTTAPDLEASVMEDIEGIANLVFDFEQLDYLSSAGLRVLLALQKIMNKQGKMVIKNVNDVIGEVFEMTGFVDFLTIV